jgi:hypothetical protein
MVRDVADNCDLLSLSRDELVELVVKHREQVARLLQSKMEQRRDFTFVKIDPHKAWPNNSWGPLLP